MTYVSYPTFLSVPCVAFQIHVQKSAVYEIVSPALLRLGLGLGLGSGLGRSYGNAVYEIVSPVLLRFNLEPIKDFFTLTSSELFLGSYLVVSLLKPWVRSRWLCSLLFSKSLALRFLGTVPSLSSSFLSPSHGCPPLILIPLCSLSLVSSPSS